MIITSINYHRSDETTEFRLNYGAKSLKNFICVDSYEDEIKIKDALDFIFDTKRTDLRSVSIRFVDDSGNTWTVEKNFENYKIYQNNSIIDMDFDTFSKEILSDKGYLNHDLNNMNEDQDQSQDQESNSDASDTRSFKDFISSQEIFIKEGKLCSRKVLTEKDQDKNKVKEDIRNDIVSKIKALNKLSMSLVGRTFSFKEASFLNNKLYPLYLSYKELLLQKATFIKEDKSKDGYDLGYIDKLGKEVFLLNQIDRKARPILNLTPIKNIKDSIERIDRELKEELEKMNVNLSFTTPPLWSELIDSLSKVEVYKKLLLSSQKMKSLRNIKIDSIYKDFIQNLENLLSNTTQITSDLEHSLNVLTTYLEVEHSQPKKNLTKLFKGFISPDSSNEEVENNRLDNSRNSVDFALSRLGELHSKLADGKKDYLEFLNKLEEAHDLLSLEYTRIRSNWNKLSKEYGIPSDISLDGIMSLSRRYYKIVALMDQKKRYKKEYLQRKESINSLKQLIDEWRTLSGSQKEDDLSNPAILLSEIEGILRYKQKKEEQFTRLEEFSNKYKFRRVVTSFIERREEDILKRWNECFSKLGMDTISITTPKLEMFFIKLVELESFYQLLSSKYSIKEDVEVFLSSNMDSYINLISVVNFNSSYIDNIENMLDSSDSKRIVFLFLRKNIIFNELKNRGFSSFIKVEKPLILKGETDIDDKDIRAIKVKSMLDIFNKPLSK